VSIEAKERLRGFLDTVRQEGIFDSEGVFTLNDHKAVGKLAQFLLPRGGFWVLKVVQAACLAQARSLHVKDSGGAVTVGLELPNPVEHAVLVNQLLLPGLELGWMAQLTQGIRGLGDRSWVGTLESRARTTQLASARGQLTSHTLDRAIAYRGSGAYLRLTTEATESSFDEENLLRAKALTCSVPLTVNGERLDHLQFDPGAESAEVLPVGVHWVTGQGRNGLVIPPGVRERSAWMYVPPFTPDRRVNRMIAVTYHYQRVRDRLDVRGVPANTSIHLVRHGVVVSTIPLPLHHPISVDMFMFADDGQVDLSGLSARLDPELLAQAEEEVTAFNASLRDLGRQLGLTRWRASRQEILGWLGLGTIALGVSPMLTPLLSLALVGWASRQGRLHSRLRGRAADALESFRRELPIVIRRG
jgi:hypothetical protein